MSINDPGQLGHFQSLYLSSNGADFWFIIDGERIPSHKLILAAMIPHYKKIFSDNNDQYETHISGVSVESFKEFLKFVYMVELNLTIDNVEGVMDLAKQWQAQEIFMECEEFLKRLLNDTSMLFFGYRLASTNEASGLKKLFLDEICAKTANAFKSVSFLTLPQEFLVKILECDRLACKEIEIFDACIAWATASCIRNGLDPSNAEQLRSQLVDSDALYQIRFTSMTNEETATCIGSHPNLFTAIELQEILCMTGHSKQFKSKKFNWTIRYYELNLKSHLNCSRMRVSDDCKTTYNVQTNEVTEFTCDRDIILHGIDLEMHHNIEEPIYIRIDERNRNLSSNECYNEPSIARFAEKQLTTESERKRATYSNSCVARIPLNRDILIRANYTYTITITFDNPNSNFLSQRTLMEKVRIDGDTVLRFSKRGIVSSLLFRRFDNRTILRKIIHSTNSWQTLAIVLYFGTAICILAYLLANIYEHLSIAWTYTRCLPYIGFSLLALFKYCDELRIVTISSYHFDLICEPLWTVGVLTMMILYPIYYYFDLMLIFPTTFVFFLIVMFCLHCR